MKVSCSPEHSDEEEWSSRVIRASQSMQKEADEWDEKTQAQWDEYKRKNALQREELRVDLTKRVPEVCERAGQLDNDNPFKDPHYF